MNQKTTALNTAKADKPLKIMKDMVTTGIKSTTKGVGRGIGKALRKIAEPSIRHNKLRNEAMAEMRQKAESGEFN